MSVSNPLYWLLCTMMMSCTTIGKEPERRADGTDAISGTAAARPAAADSTAAATIINAKRLLKESIDKAHGGNLDRLDEARAMLDGVPAGSPLREVAQYWAAYADYHAMIALMTTDKDHAVEYIDRAIDVLESLVDHDEGFAEGWALLSTSYGLKASTGSFAGMKYGPASAKAINTAMELAPHNPRVLLVAGISKYYTPAAYGGDKDRALAYFRQSAAILDSQSTHATTVEPDWGHAEAYTYIGISMMDRGDIAAARSVFEHVLEIEPEFGWVKYELLPRLPAAGR
jgi:tetratricopeptide (TPR) repeat protein